MSKPEHHHRIDYIELPAPDLGASKAFYTAAFGWSFQDYGPTYAAFDDGRMAGGLDGAGTPGTTGALVVFFSMDLEGSLAKISAAGGKIVKPIFAFPGGRRFHFTDPAGNELAMWAQPVKAG